MQKTNTATTAGKPRSLSAKLNPSLRRRKFSRYPRQREGGRPNLAEIFASSVADPTTLEGWSRKVRRVPCYLL